MDESMKFLAAQVARRYSLGDDERSALSASLSMNKAENDQLLLNDHKILEAFTVMWAAGAIAAGILSWAGGKLMESLFGDDRESIVVDIASMLEETIQRIAHIVAVYLDQQTLRDATTHLEAVQIRFEHYVNSKTQDRLFAATASIELLESRLRSLGIMAHEAFLVALGLHVAILQERQVFLGVDEKKNIGLTLRRGIKHAEKLHESWEPAIRGLYSIDFEEVYDFPRGAIRLWSLKKRGRLLDRAEGRVIFLPDEPPEHWIRLIQAAVDAAEQKYVEPSRNVVAKWQELLSGIEAD